VLEEEDLKKALAWQRQIRRPVAQRLVVGAFWISGFVGGMALMLVTLGLTVAAGAAMADWLPHFLSSAYRWWIPFFVTLAVWAVVWGRFRKAVRSVLAEPYSQSVGREVRLVANVRGIFTWSDGAAGFCGWGRVTEIATVGDRFLLREPGNSVWTIPRRAFGSAEEQRKFHVFAEHHLNAAKSASGAPRTL
jgi:hypothetical protein